MMAEEPCKDTGATNGQELDHRLKTIENSIGVIQQGLASILQAQINGRRAAKAAKYTRPSTRMQLWKICNARLHRRAYWPICDPCLGLKLAASVKKLESKKLPENKLGSEIVS